MHTCILVLSFIVSGVFLMAIALLSKQLGQQPSSCLKKWLFGENTAIRNRQLGIAVLILGVIVNAAIKCLAARDLSDYAWIYEVQRDFWVAFTSALGAVFISNGYSVSEEKQTEGDHK